MSGANTWDNSAKWGLIDPVYPSGTGITTIIQKGSSAQNLSLNSQSVTIGELRIGDGGAGSGTWNITGPGMLNLQNTSGMAKIYTTGGTQTISANLQATGGIEFTGNSALLITHASTKITGGIKKSSTAATYFYYGSQIVDQNFEFASAGSINLGLSTTATFNNNFNLTGSGNRTIANNTPNGTGRLVLNGSISGDATTTLYLMSEGNRTNIIELQAINTHAGATLIGSNIEFHSINNLGLGAITFQTYARTLTYASGNTADITKNSSDDVRAVTLNIDTTINTGANNVTWENAVTGTSRLLKTGSGDLALLGNNSFNGATVSDGSLIAGHANALGGASKDISIEDTGRLEILEGISVSAATLTLESDAAFTFNLGATNVTSFSLSGNQIGDGTFSVLVNEGTGFAGAGAYTLLSVGGTFAADINAFQLDNLSTAQGTLDWSNGNLVFNAIPEPSAGLLLALAGFAFLLCRNRKG